MRHMMRILRASGASYAEYQMFIDELTGLINEYPEGTYDFAYFKSADRDTLKRNRRQLQELQEKLYGGVK